MLFWGIIAFLLSYIFVLRYRNESYGAKRKEMVKLYHQLAKDAVTKESEGGQPKREAPIPRGTPLRLAVLHGRGVDARGDFVIASLVSGLEAHQRLAPLRATVITTGPAATLRMRSAVQQYHASVTAEEKDDGTELHPIPVVSYGSWLSSLTQVPVLSPFWWCPMLATGISLALQCMANPFVDIYVVQAHTVYMLPLLRALAPSSIVYLWVDSVQALGSLETDGAVYHPPPRNGVWSVIVSELSGILQGLFLSSVDGMAIDSWYGRQLVLHRYPELTRRLTDLKGEAVVHPPWWNLLNGILAPYPAGEALGSPSVAPGPITLQCLDERIGYLAEELQVLSWWTQPHRPVVLCGLSPRCTASPTAVAYRQAEIALALGAVQQAAVTCPADATPRLVFIERPSLGTLVSLPPLGGEKVTLFASTSMEVKTVLDFSGINPQEVAFVPHRIHRESLRWLLHHADAVLETSELSLDMSWPVAVLSAYGTPPASSSLAPVLVSPLVDCGAGELLVPAAQLDALAAEQEAELREGCRKESTEAAATAATPLQSDRGVAAMEMEPKALGLALRTALLAQPADRQNWTEKAWTYVTHSLENRNTSAHFAKQLIVVMKEKIA